MPPNFPNQLAPLLVKLHGQLALLGYPSVADDLPKPSCVLGPERPIKGMSNFLPSLSFFLIYCAYLPALAPL